jgi:drug/metabolite transporter (DMT)-like permease
MLAMRRGDARMTAPPNRGIAHRPAPWLIALTLMWGSNWPMMKLSLAQTGPLWFRAITMTGGVLLLATWVACRGVRLAPQPSEWGPLATLALPNIVAWHLFSILGLTQLPAGRAGILAFTMPVWTVVLGALFFGARLTRRALVASACALAAVALLSAQEWLALSGAPLGVLWLQIAAVSWALGTQLMRRSTLTLAPEAIVVWMMVLGSAVFTALALAFEPAPQPAAWSRTMWASMVWGVVVNFGISQAIWFTLARQLTPQASTFSMMAVPLVGVASSIVILGERPHATDALAAAFIVAAIAVAHYAPRRAAA